MNVYVYACIYMHKNTVLLDETHELYQYNIEQIHRSYTNNTVVQRNLRMCVSEGSSAFTGDGK